MEFRRTIAAAILLGAVLLLPIPGTASDSATPDSFTPPDKTDPTAQRLHLLDQLGVTAWHRDGYRGRGLKIAILDTGFRGYRDHLGKSLPERVTARSFRTDRDLEASSSQHGLLCGEVVHTIAPEAELVLANWERDRPDTFLAALTWAQAEGARIVSCSVIMPTWSDGEGHGVVHRALSRLLGSDVLCFASAGNTAQRHWSGSFHDDGKGFHEWLSGETVNVVKPWGGERVSIEVCWHTATTYEITVEDALTGNEMVHGTTTLIDDRSCAVARFQPQEGRIYRLRLRKVQGEAGPFHLVVLGGGLARSSFQGSIAFPADGPEVIAVGAVDRDGRRCAYSSCGPNSESPKPDLAAEVPFPCTCRSRPFAGTSAAAPQAAALAALIWCRHPDWTAAQIRGSMQDSAAHVSSGKHDCDIGYGCIRLPAEGQLDEPRPK